MEKKGREERMAVLSNTVSASPVPPPVASTPQPPEPAFVAPAMEMAIRQEVFDPRPESAAGVALAFLNAAMAPELSDETFPVRMLTPPLSPNPHEGIGAEEEAVRIELHHDAPPSEAPTVASSELSPDAVVDGPVKVWDGLESEEIIVSGKEQTAALGVSSFDETVEAVGLTEPPLALNSSILSPATELAPTHTFPAPPVIETSPALLHTPENTLSLPLSDRLPPLLPSSQPAQDPTESIPLVPLSQELQNPFKVPNETEDDHDLEYISPAIGLRSSRHGSLVHGTPLPPTSTTLPRTLIHRKSSTSDLLSDFAPHQAVTTETTVETVMDEPTTIKSALGRLMQQYVGAPPSPPHNARSRGRESPVLGQFLSSPPQKSSISMSRSYTSLTKPGGSPGIALERTASSGRSKLRSASSAIPLPSGPVPHQLTRVAMAHGSPAMSPVPSFSPDLILSEDEGDWGASEQFLRGPMPSPLLERRRESIRLREQQMMMDESYRWKVMISYCWEDVSLPCDPRKIAQHLTDAGVSCWLDIERLDSRRSVFPQLIDGILRSDVTIVCVSKAWTRSAICNKEFRLIAQLKVPVLLVQIGETRSGAWRRIARVTMQNPSFVDASRPKNVKATLDTILSETRWLVSRSLANGLSSPSLSNTPSMNRLGRALSTSSTTSSYSIASSTASTAVSPSPSPHPPSISRTPSALKRYSGHADGFASSFHHPSHPHTPSPLSNHPSGADSQDTPGVIAIKRQADRGDSVAQFRLGVLNDAGIGVMLSSTLSSTPSPYVLSTLSHSPAATSAFRWFSAAADRGHCDALYRLGNLYERGRGIQRDLEKAKHYYEMAFSLGCPDAGCALAGVTREIMRIRLKEGRSPSPHPPRDGSIVQYSRSSTPLSQRGSPPLPPETERWNEDAIAILERAAALGSIRAMFRLGIATYDRRDFVSSAAWFRRAAEEGDDGVAMFNLGTMAEKGRGVRKSLADAAKWYTLAADHRFDVAAVVASSSNPALASAANGSIEYAMASVHAIFNLGVFYEHGWGVEKNLAKCVEMYKEAAAYGHVRAQFNYGVCLKKGRGTRRNLEDAVKWFFKAADQGHVDAQFNLGNSYKYGEGVEKDIKEAARWYSKASDAGHSKAQFNLALCYDEGEGIEKDAAEAARLYRLSAEAGNAISQFYYATALEQGRGVERDIGEAARMYRLAAEQGDPDAAAGLAHCYLSGDGIAKSYKDAIKWFRVAADAGEPDAQYMLGMLLKKGETNSGSKSSSEALLWLRRSARQGHADALFEVGVAHEIGFGVPIDFGKASRWFARAAKAGHPTAAQRIVIGHGSRTK
ncbi:hypothetical protein HDU97_001252 [Phlyctochytrium planicorne]|nr:hypothetical protein HDU97_001252 [Phlyctochytrium planicorne]